MGAGRLERVLEGQGVALAVCSGRPGDGDDDAVVAAQVQGQLAAGALRGEARAAERLRVQVAVEARRGLALRDAQVGAACAPTDPVVRVYPEARVPGPGEESVPTTPWPLLEEGGGCSLVAAVEVENLVNHLGAP